MRVLSRLLRAAPGVAAALSLGAARAADLPGWSAAGHADLDAMAGIHGGQQLGSASSLLVQWGASLDTAAAGLWRGGLLEFSIEGVRANASPNAGTGMLQWPNNEWAPNFLRVYQATYRQDWGPAAVRAGVMDINQYFESSDVSDGLHNASFGLAPTLTGNFNDPSFPNPGLGLMGELRLAPAWRARAAVWQGNPPGLGQALHQGWLQVAEIERDWDGPAAAAAPAADLKAGVWRYRQPDPLLGHDTAGAYVVGERRWRTPGRDWGAFVLAGNAPAAVNAVSGFVAGGVRVGAPFAARPDDAFSLGAARVNPRGAHPETVLEAVYAWKWRPGLSLQPDVQRVWNPVGGTSASAWVAGLRVHWEF